MFQKLRTVIYHAPDLVAVKEWYSKILGKEPYFDQPFYVGFEINGCELGLDPDPSGVEKGNQVIAYWAVTGIDECVKKLEDAGATIRTAVQEVGGGIKVATVNDPWGNAIGVIEES